MIEQSVVEAALKAPDGWIDTPEQAQLRECLTTVMSGHSETETIQCGLALITVMRDQLAAGVGNLRRYAAVEARKTMSPAEIAAATGQSRATIHRLVTEHRKVK